MGILGLYNFDSNDKKIASVNKKQNVNVHETINYKQKADSVEMAMIRKMEKSNDSMDARNMTRKQRQKLKKISYGYTGLTSEIVNKSNVLSYDEVKKINSSEITKEMVDARMKAIADRKARGEKGLSELEKQAFSIPSSKRWKLIMVNYNNINKDLNINEK